jgi:hypothetical protein
MTLRPLIAAREYLIVCVALLPAVALAETAWQYTMDTDEMTGKRNVTVIAESVNSLGLRAPHGGVNHAHLHVRQHARYGLQVLLEIDKGQFVCSLNECRVLVRFDDEAPVYFSAAEPADYSSTYLFLSPASRFVKAAAKARQIRVQANIYQEGAPVLEFSPTPLVWPWPKVGASSTPSKGR